MTSWKLVGAAIKAQRTWANLSPEQKEQVRKKATVAARSAVHPHAGAQQAQAGSAAGPSRGASSSAGPGPSDPNPSSR